MDTSKKFIYINNESGDRDNSVNVPVSTLCGMETLGTNSMHLYFKEAVESDTLDVILLRTSDSDPRPIMESIVHEINHGKNSTIVLADDFSKKYLHPDISSVSSIADASAESIVRGDITLGDSINDKVEINGKLIQGYVTVTDVDTQDHTLTASEFRDGIVVHTSTDGAGTITFDNAVNLRSTLELGSDNEVAKCLYVNDGDQYVTLNGGAPSGVTYKTNPTIPPGGTATLMVRRTSFNEVEVYILAHATASVQSPSVSVTATTDGSGTGTIADGTSYVTVTSDSADKIVVLPTPTPGNIVHIFVGANGYELRSNDPATVAINGGTGTDSESAIGANVLVRCVCTSATTWVATQFAADGTVSAVEAANTV